MRLKEEWKMDLRGNRREYEIGCFDFKE